MGAEVATQPRRKRRVIATVSPRMQMWMDGDLKPEDLTDEEVNRMQLMDHEGMFRGRPAQAIPRDLAQAFRSEAQKRLMAWFQEQVPIAQKAYRDLMKARHLSPGDAAKLRAAEGVFERVIGKVPNATDMHVVMNDKKTFEEHASEIIMDLDVEEDDE